MALVQRRRPRDLLRQLGPRSQPVRRRWPDLRHVARGGRGSAALAPDQRGDRTVRHRRRTAAHAAPDRLHGRPPRRHPLGGLRPVGAVRPRRTAGEPFPVAVGRHRQHPDPQDVVREPERVGEELHDRRHHRGDHDHPDHHIDHAGGVRDRPRVTEGGRARARRHALGDDPRRRVPAQPQRHGRRHDDRPRTGDGRDDRDRPGGRRVASHHSQHPRARRHAREHHRQPVRRGQRHAPGRADRLRCRAVRHHDHHQHCGAGGGLPSRAAIGRDGVTAPAVPLTQSTRKGRREFKNALATAFMVGSFVVALVPLTLIVVYVLRAGISVFGLSFLTEDLPFSNRIEGGGMNAAIVGTLVITGTATAMAVPLGVLGGIYLNEYGGSGLVARIVRFLADVMTGVPSIVMGLFIYTIWVLPRKQAGLSGFAGALALGCLMLPIVIRTTEEILKVVPEDLREGSYALGCRKAQTIRRVVLPSAAPGIISGALLGVARVAGETAPLLFTIGIVSTPNWNVFDGPNTALPQQIYINASVFGGFDAAKDRAWGAALALILIVFLFTLIARVISAVYARRSAAA